MSDAQRTRNRAGGSLADGGVALVEFARALTDASSLEELERAFRPRFGRLMNAPMYGFYTLDAEGSRIEHNVAVNVSDVFVARYARAMDAARARSPRWSSKGSAIARSPSACT